MSTARSEEGRSGSVAVESVVRPEGEETPSKIRESFPSEEGSPSSSASSLGVVAPVSTVDDDQDRRNPQYIPKRGVFYEHDDRIDSSDEDEAPSTTTATTTTTATPSTAPSAPQSALESPSQSEEIPLKKQAPSKASAFHRWGHDKFTEFDQAPKTKDELVSVYGYDIRNEDTAPRARRRRKYGRGPNKYTRKWENEDAYVKSAGGRGNNVAQKGAAQRGMPKRGGGPGKTPRAPPDGGEAATRAEIKEQPAPMAPLNTNNANNSSNSSKKEGQLMTKQQQQQQQQHQQQQQPSSLIKDPLHPKKDTTRGPPRIDPPPKNGVSSSSRLEHVEKAMSRTHISNNNNTSSGYHPASKTISSSSSSSNPRRLPDKNPGVSGSGEGGARTTKRYSSQRQRNNNNNSIVSIGKRKEDVVGASGGEYFNQRGSGYQVSCDYPSPRDPSGSAPPYATNPAASPSFPSSTTGAPNPAAVPPPYINPNGLYGPPVQYTVPVTVPVTVPLTMSLVSETFSGVPLVPPPLAAVGGPAGAPPNTGYAEVRRGVTYFNPTAQAPVLLRPVNKRPKAAIPIIDPSNLSGGDKSSPNATTTTNTTTTTPTSSTTTTRAASEEEEEEEEENNSPPTPPDVAPSSSPSDDTTQEESGNSPSSSTTNGTEAAVDIITSNSNEILTTTT